MCVFPRSREPSVPLSHCSVFSHTTVHKFPPTSTNCPIPHQLLAKENLFWGNVSVGTKATFFQWVYQHKQRVVDRKGKSKKYVGNKGQHIMMGHKFCHSLNIYLSANFWLTQVRSLSALDTIILTHSITDFVETWPVTLVCKDPNSELVDVVTIANVDTEEHVDDSSIEILRL